MKTVALLILGAALNAAAQYEITWFTFDGGGGQSSGGAYTLAGTIGQPDAGSATGGPYTLASGFWSFTSVVSTEGPPTLRILRDGANVLLAWPNPSIGFQLQETPSLSSPNWTDVNRAPGVAGDEKQVSQPIALGTRFYRLRRP